MEKFSDRGEQSLPPASDHDVPITADNWDSHHSAVFYGYHLRNHQHTAKLVSVTVKKHVNDHSNQCLLVDAPKALHISLRVRCVYVIPCLILLDNNKASVPRQKSTAPKPKLLPTIASDFNSPGVTLRN